MTWAEFVGAMTDLAATRGQTHFVMSVGEHVIIERTGRLLVDVRHVELGEIEFSIERIEGKGGGAFQITQGGWGGAEWLPAQEPTRALKIWMKIGHPVFSLQVQPVTV